MRLWISTQYSTKKKVCGHGFATSNPSMLFRTLRCKEHDLSLSLFRSVQSRKTKTRCFAGLMQAMKNENLDESKENRKSRRYMNSGADSNESTQLMNSATLKINPGVCCQKSYYQCGGNQTSCSQVGLGSWTHKKVG